VYATQADLERAIGKTRLLRIADREDDEVVDADVVEDALRRASSEIDSAIGGRYKLPISPVPDILRSVAIDLAHYHLDLDPQDDLTSRAKAARTQLMQISKGISHLTDAELSSAGQPVSAVGPNTHKASVKRFQTGLDMSGFGE